MVDTETFVMVLERNPCVSRTHISPSGESLRADGNPNCVEIEVELDSSEPDEMRDDLHDTATQNGWSVDTNWGSRVWLLIQS